MQPTHNLLDERLPPIPVYRGEVKARSRKWVVALTLFCPGLGWAYIGEFLTAIIVCLLYVSAAGLFVVAWSTWKFFPVLPAAVLLSGGLVLSILQATQISARVSRHGPDYILKSTNNVVVYVLTALVFYFMPLIGLGHFTSNHLWRLLWVEGEAMYPTLVDGDVLLVDLTAYRGREPVSGDIVVVQRLVDGETVLAVGRIIGEPSDSVEVVDSIPWINDEAVRRELAFNTIDQQHQEDNEVASLLDIPVLVGITVYHELLRGIRYLTAESERPWGVQFGPVVLNENQYFVLHDNRSRSGDSRDYGPVPRDHIIGQPLYVAFSVDNDGSIRNRRIATRTQPGSE